jgi:hypothetical protein
MIDLSRSKWTVQDFDAEQAMAQRVRFNGVRPEVRTEAPAVVPRPIAKVQLWPELKDTLVHWRCETYDAAGCRTGSKFRNDLRSSGSVLVVHHLAAVRWLLSQDKKEYRQRADLFDKTALYDGPVTWQWLRISTRPIVVETAPVYLCPKTGILWLEPDDAPVARENGTLFVLRRLPARAVGMRIWMCGEDHDLCVDCSGGAGKFRLKRILDVLTRRVWMTAGAAHVRLTGANWRDWKKAAWVSDPREPLYETRWQCQQRLKRWARDRQRRIEKRRLLTDRERMFFRLMAAGAALAKAA